MICIFSEFDRNTFENDSGGTDHGWGSAMVVMGGAVTGGVFGATPTAAEIANQPWIYEDVDFRNVLAKIIDWLGFNPDPVFPESYSKVGLSFL